MYGIYIYVYIYVYMSVCVCMSVYVRVCIINGVDVKRLYGAESRWRESITKVG